MQQCKSIMPNFIYKEWQIILHIHLVSVTLHGLFTTRATSHMVSNSKSHVIWGQIVQSQPSRAWKLAFTYSHRSQALNPKSFEVNLCNLNHREHGSEDSPLHMGLKSQAWHGCLHGKLFEGEAWGLCWELGWAQSQTQSSPVVFFLHKIIKIRLKW